MVSRDPSFRRGTLTRRSLPEQLTVVGRLPTLAHSDVNRFHGGRAAWETRGARQWNAGISPYRIPVVVALGRGFGAMEHKPQRFFVHPEDPTRVLLIDFGLATRLVRHTQTQAPLALGAITMTCSLVPRGKAGS